MPKIKNCMTVNYLYVTAFAVVFLILLAPIIGDQSSSATPASSVYLTKPGLLVSDPLNNETKTQQQLEAQSGYWSYGGDAKAQNANYTLFKDAQGLHIGVQAPSPGTYAGFYAKSQSTNAFLFHAVTSVPLRTIPNSDNLFQNGINVKTSQPILNYISCGSITDKLETKWIVGHTYGTPLQSAVFEMLYIDTSPNQPLSRDCTIITNGQNLLKVYLDGVLVYSSETLALGMPEPFDVYLQATSSYNGQLIQGTYTDYYITSGESIEVFNNPTNATTVTITDASGNVFASAPVSNGTATINVGQFHFPLNGKINVYGSDDTLVSSTPNAVDIFGGDQYSADGPPPPTAPQSPTDLSATVISSSQIDLSWTAPSDDGGSAITGYQIEKSTDGGTSWSILVANTNSASTTYSDTGLSPSTTYSYRVSAINSAGTSSPSNVATVTTTVEKRSIVLNNVQSTSGTTPLSNQIVLTNFNVGTGKDRLLVVGVQASGNPVSSITFGGTQLKKAVSSFNYNVAELWYLKNPVGTADIVVTMGGSARVIVGAYSFFEVDQRDPIPTIASNTGSTSTPTIFLATKYPDSWVVDSASIYGDVSLSDSTCVQRWNIQDVGDPSPFSITGASSSIIKESAGLVTCSWTASRSDLWDDVAIELKVAPVPTAPSPPAGLSATGLSPSQISLSWSEPSDNGGTAITGYKIERSANSGTSWSVLEPNTNSASTTYTDGGLTESTTYQYRVSAINLVGTSSPSNVASGTTNIQSDTITVFAHRIPASYWSPCFATECSAGTGPGASMYFALLDSSGNTIREGFADEHGLTFTGLNQTATYYVYPADCNLCHASFHDVVFEYWGDNQSTVRPRAATTGTDLHAWYSCTNSCGGLPH